jgi:tetratricopeptide (TPR) repeat protein
MNFNCQTPTCAIALSKASFPVAMNCPVCQTLLVKQEEEPAISADEENLIASLPYVIAYPLRRTLAEKHLGTKVNLLKDTFLNYLKYLGLISASEFFNSNLKDKKMVALFQQALAEPSFGSWNQYIRETLQFLKEQQHPFFCAELVDYYEAVETGKKRKLYKGEIEYIDSNGDVQLKKQEATAIGMLINFRNRYLGHGLTLDEKAAQQLWDEYFPLFRTLLEQMQFASQFTMFKHEHGETYKMQSAEISTVEKGAQTSSQVWLENPLGDRMDILPFFVVPGEVSLAKEDKEKILTYESYTGKTIKFFSPEGTEKQSSGKILEKLNILLRDKQKEKPYAPDEFSKEIFIARVADENKLILDTLIAEKKVIPGVYVHREDMEIKLREWIGARMSILFIAAEAGSGKTNLLVEMQKQYTEREIPTLLIRAGRMEKHTLGEQLAYLLNIDATENLSNYKHIAGTQASPTMVLIDGLNEAAQAEALWQEVLDISKTFEPGSLKFVATSRANSKADIERYALAEYDENLVYGENKDHEQGLGAHTHWLTALNMAEMKNAWEDYVQKDKNKYKPQFSFDDLATFDRALYNSISNPLVLRLFLETYHNKGLPNKGNKHLNIWADWLTTFSDAEQEFFKLLADAIWEKGENELLLDDMLKNENLKSYFTDDRINAPYPRLKNNGWISRYIKDLNTCVAFTVEGALLFIFGKQLQNKSTQIDVEFIDNMLEQGSKLHKAGLESFLCEEGMKGELGLITKLIDAGGDKLEICIRPLLHYIKAFGVEDTFNKLLEDTTENDWKALLMMNDQLDELQLLSLKKEYSYSLYNQSIKLDLELPIKLLLNILPEISYPINEELLSTIENKLISENPIKEEVIEFKKKLAYYCTMNGFPEKGINLYKGIYNIEDIEDPSVLNKIGAAYDGIGEDKEALKYYYAAKEKATKSDLNNSKLLAQIYFNLAHNQNNEIDKLKDYKNVFELESSIYGIIHSETARTIGAIGLTYIKLNKFDQAFKKLNEALLILNKLGVDLIEIYQYFGYYYYKTEDYNNSFEFYEKALSLSVSKLGEDNDGLIDKYTNLGDILEKLGDDRKSLAFFEKADLIISNSLSKDKNTLFYIKFSLGNSYFHISEYSKSIIYYNDSLNIYLNNPSDYIKENVNNLYYYLGYSYYRIGDYYKASLILHNLSNLTIDIISIENFLENFELIGHCFFYLENYEYAIESYKKTIPYYEDIHAKFNTIELIAACYENLNKFESALLFYKKCIEMATEIDNLIDLWKVEFRLGACSQALNDFYSAIKFFKSAFEKNEKDYILENIARCYELLEQKKEAIKYYIKCSEIRKVDPEFGLGHVSTKASIEHALRLSVELGIENELPEWMKNI